MSTDQPQLSDYTTDLDPHEQALQDRGAAYGASDPAPTPPAQLENACRNCGREIPPRLARVLGDNQGCIPACAAPECRQDVLEEASLAHGDYDVTARVVRAVRSNAEGVSADPTAGGRR